MNRLEKKCFIASAATHGLLLVLLFAAPAMMFSKKKESPVAVLTFLPDIATDQNASGGGDPTVTQPPAPLPAVPQPQPLQQVEPPPAAPVTQQQPEAVPEVKVEPVKPSKKVKSEPEPVADKPLSKNGIEPVKKKKKETPKTDENETADTKDKPDTFKPSFTPSSRNQKLNTKNAEAKARADAAARAAAAQRAFASKIQQSLKSLGAGFAPGTSIEVPGTGGATFANYKLIVEAMYQQAWITPEDVNEESVVVRAKVVIRRDGTVIEARPLKPSGIRAMDKSVERALELKFIAPFPDDSKDSERLFYINFDLKTKRLLG